MTNDTTTNTPVPPIVPPTPTPSIPTPAPVVPEPSVVIPSTNSSTDTNASTFVPTFEGPDSGNLGNFVVLQVDDCPDCQVRIISPDGSIVVLTPDSSGAVRLNLNLAGRYNAALLRNGQVVSTLSVNSIGNSTPQPPSSPSFDLTLCLGAGVVVLVIGGAIYFVKRRRGGRGNK